MFPVIKTFLLALTALSVKKFIRSASAAVSVAAVQIELLKSSLPLLQSLLIFFTCFIFLNVGVL